MAVVSFKDARAELQRLIAAKRLPEVQASVLETLALDDHGYQQSAATSILAAAIRRSQDECSNALIDLLGANLILQIEDRSHRRLVANYQLLGLSEEARQAITAGYSKTYEVLDAPHSAEAMGTLHALFREEQSPLYFGLEMTSHQVFQALEDRARAGYMTVFLMPAREHVAVERQRHYDEILQSWLRFLQQGPQHLRDNTRLRITSIPYKYLYTSALAKQFVRFDCYWYDQGTTRRGTMLKAERGSSLYDLVQSEYAEAVENSAPHRRIWPHEWVKHHLFRFAPLAVAIMLVVAALGLSLYFGPQANWVTFVGGFLTGLAGEAIWDFYRSRLRKPRALFES